MSRTNATAITAGEVDIFTAFCKKHHIKDVGDDGVHNGELVGWNYINILKTDITEQSLEENLDGFIKAGLRMYDENQKVFLNAWDKATPQEKKVFSDYWSVGRQLEANDFNYALILGWIKGHDLAVSESNISRAVEMLRDKLTWKYQPTFKSRVSQAEKDAHTTPGRFISDANLSPSDHKKRMDDAYAANRGEKKTSSEVNEARREAESLAGRNHYETEEIRKPLVADKSGNVDWQSTLRLRKLRQQSFEKARQVRGFQR